MHVNRTLSGGKEDYEKEDKERKKYKAFGDVWVTE